MCKNLWELIRTPKRLFSYGNSIISPSTQLHSTWLRVHMTKAQAPPPDSGFRGIWDAAPTAQVLQEPGAFSAVWGHHLVASWEHCRRHCLLTKIPPCIFNSALSTPATRITTRAWIFMLCFLIHPKCLEQHMVRSRHSISIGHINEIHFFVYILPLIPE